MAREARELVEAFTGGDPGIRRSLKKMYREEGPETVLGGTSMDLAPGVWEYMARAGEALDARAPSRATGTRAES